MQFQVLDCQNLVCMNIAVVVVHNLEDAVDVWMKGLNSVLFLRIILQVKVAKPVSDDCGTSPFFAELPPAL